MGTPLTECRRWQREICERAFRCLGDRAVPVEECVAAAAKEDDGCSKAVDVPCEDPARAYSGCADNVAESECGECDPSKQFPLCFDLCMVPTTCTETR